MHQPPENLDKGWQIKQALGSEVNLWGIHRLMRWKKSKSVLSNIPFQGLLSIDFFVLVILYGYLLRGDSPEDA